MAIIPRRRAVLQIDGQFLIDIFKEGEDLRCYKVTKGIPTDAKIAGAEYNSVYDRWEIAIESESFEEVPPWETLPILPACEETSFFHEHVEGLRALEALNE